MIVDRKYVEKRSSSFGNIYGGTWEEYGKGRTLVGVDSSDSDFSTVEKLGGEKTHTLTIDEMPSHSHRFKNGEYDAISILYDDGSNKWYGIPINNGFTFSSKEFQINDTGGSQAHNNLQPYITTYMWKRTA